MARAAALKIVMSGVMSFGYCGRLQPPRITITSAIAATREGKSAQPFRHDRGVGWWKDLACEQLAIATRLPGTLCYGQLKLRIGKWALGHYLDNRKRRVCLRSSQLSNHAPAVGLLFIPCTALRR
jgi:hypothetical protein